MNLFKRGKGFISKLTFALVLALVILMNAGIAQASTINDIDASADYSKPAILNLADSGIISGNDKGYFYPQQIVKRSEIVKMIVKALNIDTSNIPKVPTFTDVPREHWAYQYVEAAYREGIIKGVTPTLFGINNNCTREQMTAMFVRAIGLMDTDLTGKQPYLFLNSMQDKEKVSSWAKEYVEFALSTGLIKGIGGNKFGARNFAERQQAAVVTDRFITNKEAINKFAQTFDSGMPYPELFTAIESNNKSYKGNVEMNMQMNLKDDTKNEMNIAMLMKGLVDASKETNLINFDINYNTTVDISADIPSVSMQYRVIKVGDNYYVQNPDQSWDAITPSELEEMGITAPNYSDNNEDILKYYRYATISKENNVVIHGETATKYTLTFGKEALKALMFGAAEGQIPELDSSAPDLKAGQINIYLNDKNQIVSEYINFTATMWDESTESNNTLNLVFDSYYYNIGQDVVIKAPEISAN